MNEFKYRIFTLKVVHVYKNILSYEITHTSSGKYVDMVSAHNDDEVMRYIDRVHFQFI